MDCVDKQKPRERWPGLRLQVLSSIGRSVWDGVGAAAYLNFKTPESNAVPNKKPGCRDATGLLSATRGLMPGRASYSSSPD